MRRFLSLVAVFLVVACNRVLDIPEATLRADDVPADDDDTTQCESGQKVCNGQCVATNNPDTGCGREGCRACNLDNATATCSDRGECVIADCSENFADCNGDPSDGCEADLQGDRANCGECGRECNGALPCIDGFCRCTTDEHCGFGGCSPSLGLCYCSTSTPCTEGAACDAPSSCAF